MAIDTEFSIETCVLKRRLAYIQLYGFDTQDVFIFTYINNFVPFTATIFLEWVEKKDSLLVGFYMLGDLINLWRLFDNPPSSACLLGKVCDLHCSRSEPSITATKI